MPVNNQFNILLRLLETELIRVICSVFAFTQDSCSARPGSTKKGCALFLVSSKLFLFTSSSFLSI